MVEAIVLIGMVLLTAIILATLIILQSVNDLKWEQKRLFREQEHQIKGLSHQLELHERDSKHRHNLKH